MYRAVVLALFFAVSVPACARGNAARDPSAATAGRSNVEIDVPQAILNCRRGKAAQADLKKAFYAKQADLDERQAALRKQREEAEKAPEGEGKESRAARWSKDADDLRALLVTYNEELNAEQKRVTEAIYHDLAKLFPALAASIGAHAVYSKEIVCEANAAPRNRWECVPWGAKNGSTSATSDEEWFKPRVDLTPQAIRALDEAAPPAPPGGG